MNEQWSEKPLLGVHLCAVPVVTANIILFANLKLIMHLDRIVVFCKLGWTTKQ
jgi:hypothetical protein